MRIRVDKWSIICYIRANMFDRIVYKILDTIVDWCERYKEYRIKRSLPKETYDKEARDKGLKKWVNQRENSYK